ncbi:MAG TPA: PLP-dependent lyase/thiolase [Acidimicrobiales bacterium]
MSAGYRCAVCGTRVAIETPWPWRCPRATATDRHHVLRIEPTPEAPTDFHLNPFVADRQRMAWYRFALAHGYDDASAVSLVEEVDEAVRDVEGSGFAATMVGPAAGLSDALGIDIWVKDETGNVAGSHKARHLMSILLHLLAAERAGVAPAGALRPRLAIASCGNAALAAATLALAADWPLDVYVPADADPVVLGRIERLGAAVVPCPRQAGGPPGDPCMARFRRAVDSGAIPFTVQGPENALCLDGGRTVGWELASALNVHGADRVFVQVGGGALATGVGDGLREAGVAVTLHAVQAEGCAPLAAAWDCAQRVGVAAAPLHWSDCMRPWRTTPTSMATGILDDETYDWLGVVDAMAHSNGSPVVASEADVAAAFDLAREATTIPVDATGAAGLAGVRAFRPHLRDDERVVVLFTGRSQAR